MSAKIISEDEQGLFGLNITPFQFLIGLITLIVSLGGGVIYDRPPISPGYSTFIALVGVFAASLIAAIGFAAGYMNNKESFRPSRIGMCFVLFVVLCGISIIGSRDSYGSCSVFAFTLSAALFGVLVFRQSRNSTSAVAVVAIITITASLISVLGINEYLAEVRNHNPLWRVFSNFTNPDFLAGYLILTIPSAAALFLVLNKPLGKALAGLGMLAQAACLVLTGSRLGLAALVLEGLFFGTVVLTSGALSPKARKSGVVIAAFLGVVLIVAGKPVFSRLVSSGAENYSAKFRLLTWQGTAKMAAAQPFTGSGLGAFEAAYPKYAVVGYTQHAHGSFLQTAAEIGIPGAILLIVGLLGTFCLAFKRKSPDEQSEELERIRPIFRAAGAAAILGTLFHNLFDSDLYVPAATFLLAANIGMLRGLATSQNTGITVKTRSGSASKILIWFPAALVLIISGPIAIGRIIATGAAADFEKARSLMASGSDSESKQSISNAIDGYKSAISVDSKNIEYRLSLAELQAATGNYTDAEATYRMSLEIHPTSKSTYRYGKFLTFLKRPAEALKLYQKSRELQPTNLQNLLQIAASEQDLRKPDLALDVYLEMSRLYTSPVGKVRAMPEIEEWEYGICFTKMADIYLDQKANEVAEVQYQNAVTVLGAFWDERNLLMATLRIKPDIRKLTSDTYDHALDQLFLLQSKEGKTAEAAKTKITLDKFRLERSEFDSKPASALTGEP